jgi:NADPH-dependent ferric siderophore reductase
MQVRRVETLSPRMIRVTFSGPDLDGMSVAQPAASVRLLLPSPGNPDLVTPTWNGNEFLLPDGRRPTIRTLTPGPVEAGDLTTGDLTTGDLTPGPVETGDLATGDLATGDLRSGDLRSGHPEPGSPKPREPELEVQIVVHDGGVASAWAESAEPGDAAAVSGPGRGYTVERDAPAYLLAGDESAIPAIGQLLEALPAEKPVQVHIEVSHPDARLALPAHPCATVAWVDLPPGAPPGDALVAAVKDADLVAATCVWVAGEAAAVQRIRRHLFGDRGLPRGQASVRGYWKHGRSGDPDDDR